jgi:hypothetical protein
MATGARVFISAVATSGVTDLFILIHGWNNSRSAAREMYRRFRDTARSMPKTPWSQSAKIGTLSVFWPSVAWPDDDDGDDETATAMPESLNDPERQRAIEEAKHMVDSNPSDAAALERLSGLVRGLDESKPAQGEESARGTGFFGSVWQGVKGTLRSASYFQMQKRASVLGRDGLRPFLTQLSEQLPQLRVHIVAHSVGARLAAHGLSAPLESDRRGPRVASFTLLQAVLSHHAFAPAAGPGNSRPGALAVVPRRVNGPVIVTFSENDKAASVAYSTATRVARDEDAPGEERGAIGALGHDGAQESRAVQIRLGPVGTAYAFEDNRIFNVEASHAISSHSDVFKPEVAWLILVAAEGGGSI